MRVIEVSVQPVGDRRDTAQQAPFGSGAIGPGAESSEHHLGSRLRDTLAARHAMQAAHQEDVRQVEADAMHAARKAGSKQAMIQLTSLLDDSWTMIRRLQYSSDGIGQILVGTHGVVAMTSLYLDATVHCHGDKLHAEKYDHHDGHSLGEIHLADQTGRPPSAQLNQAANELEKSLKSSGIKISVLRVVLFNHPRSRVEESRRPTAQIFASPYDLARWLRELPKILDRGQRKAIEELISGHKHQAPHEPHDH